MADENEIDRSKIVPHLLRVFWKVNRHNPVHEYKDVSKGKYPSNEIQIYTWPDATLRELTDLLKSTVSEARNKNATLEFHIMAPDRNEQYLGREVGKVASVRPGSDDDKTLSDVRFVIGDCIDVAIFLGRGGGGGGGGGGHMRQGIRYQ